MGNTCFVISLTLAALFFCAGGCVSPETATKIDALERQIEDIATKHQAGELSTKEAT